MSESLERYIGSSEESWLTSTLCRLRNNTLLNHVIEFCNAIKPVPFTKADIVLQGFVKFRSLSLGTLKPGLPCPATGNFRCISYHKLFKTWLFTGVAKEGLKAVPQGHEEAFICLLKYIRNKEFHEGAISNYKKSKCDETGLTAVLAEHFFSQLTPDHSYFIDGNATKKPDDSICPCKVDRCRKVVNIGNTAIGSSLVWHGCPDIFIDEKVPVIIVNDASTFEDKSGIDVMPPVSKKMKKETDGVSGEGSSKTTEKATVELCVEVKNKAASDILLNINVIDQIMAEAITNAFAQVNANKVLKGLVIPSFGCSQEHVLVFLYDPVHDVLLQNTNLIKLFEVPDHLSIVAIIQVWIFLNFTRFFEENLATKYKFKSARFHDCVMDCFSQYKNASYKEKLAPSETSYIAEVVVPFMANEADQVEEKT